VPTFITKIQPREISFLSSHFYWTGPPTDPKVQIDTLLQPNGWFDYNMKRDMEASKASGLPFRNTEGNSCYRGGKDGVSNVYASALWATDYCLQLARWGAVGATFHSGGVANYSPIAGDSARGYEIRPEFCGLLLVSNLQGAKLVESEFKCEGVNANAYAFLAGRKRKVVVVNKDRVQDIDLRIEVQGSAIVSRLSGPSLDSKTGTTLGGALVSGTGTWKPAKGERFQAVSGAVTVPIPAASAAVIEF
jgi:glycosyl hydrolase family 79